MWVFWSFVRFFDLFAFYIDIKFFLLFILINIKHGAFVLKENHKYLYSFCLKESAGPGGVERLHKCNLWYFRQHFPNIGYWECASYANNTMLGNSIEKSESDIVNIVKKSTVNSLASIYFQFCFKYIIPCYTMLCHQILSLAMGSNFHIASSSLPATIVSHFVEYFMTEIPTL